MINEIFKIINGVQIEVNSKVELLGIFITLSDEPLNEQYKNFFSFSSNNNKYIEEIKESFSYLIENNMVDYFNYIKNKYKLHYHIPIEFALNLNNSFEIENKNVLFNNDEIKEFLNMLKSVYESKEFINFYNSHKSIYLSWVEDIQDIFSKFDITQTITNYCGEKYSNLKYYLTLIAFETSGGYGIKIGDKAYYCLRARKSAEENKLFTSSYVKTYLPITIHEFLHSIVNELTRLNGVFTFDSSYLINDYESREYSNDFSIVNETIVRALTIRIYNILTNQDDSKERLEKEVKNGFIYVPLIYSKLIEYEKHKDTYYEIDEFYPILAKSLIDKE